VKKYISFIIFFIFINTIYSKEISISLLITTPTQRYTIREIIKEFEDENPDLTVKIYEANNDNYHNYIKKREFLNSDIIWWFAGYQLQSLYKQGYVEPINDLWNEQNLYSIFSKNITHLSYNNNILAIPISYYQWGFYYNKNIFKKYNLSPPKTWDEFINICEILKNNAIKPLILSLQDKWTLLSWFSYLNLRINGIEFHRKLLNGEISFYDEKIKSIFIKWKFLLDNDYFLDTKDEYGWQSVTPYLFREKVAMLLSGNFIISYIPKNFKKNIDFFRFPIITNSLPLYEEKPTDIFFLNKYSKNKNDAKKLLLFLTKYNIQTKFNSSLGFLPYNKNSDISNYEYLTKKGKELINNTINFTQFFDRDTDEKFATISADILYDFVKNQNISSTIDRLELARKDIFK
jgi:multiple sugar transport system substrate-binding protein